MILPVRLTQLPEVGSAVPLRCALQWSASTAATTSQSEGGYLGAGAGVARTQSDAMRAQRRRRRGGRRELHGGWRSPPRLLSRGAHSGFE
jgi:hypothetical protein